MITRQKVLMVRDVVSNNYGGEICGKRTEVIEVIIEWPGEIPANTPGQYVDYFPWRIATVLEAKPE